ncbi:MAG TPA: UDP-N-acetylmuramoyl-L-alanine--D-glutamate ligase [Solirubrobacteraceae bacterium]|nr:UDP-N-acetylmuramoyl-L-alanine--D-glutamate ligase [Solirubrobacteraceae bacterium]
MKFSELDGKRIALWGLGRETTAFRDQLEQRLPSAKITAVIDDSTPEPEARAEIANADVLVRSPGVSLYKPLIQDAIGAGKIVTTATGLWLAEREGHHVIGVTGTKGKSTTATVIAHLLSQLRPDTELAGNIGRPVIELLDLAGAGARNDAWVVCELSSYQLADLTTGPEVAVLTNLYREHTDWHGSEAQYRADKLRIFELPGTRIAVRPPDGGWPVTFAPGELPLRGRHNAQNVAAALAAIEAAGFQPPALPEALMGLPPLPHRLQTVHTDEHGNEWVDDSISTTPESTIAALDAFGDRQVVLIAGGSERQQDYDSLGRALAGRSAGTALVYLPDTGPLIAAAAIVHRLSPQLARPARDMETAVAIAAEMSTPGGVVLLSPAAPSFNAYKDFEERGDDFAACAKAVALRA